MMLHLHDFTETVKALSDLQAAMQNCRIGKTYPKHIALGVFSIKTAIGHSAHKGFAFINLFPPNENDL